MNEYERQRRIAESTKKLYPPGTRIELLSMSDPYADVYHIFDRVTGGI